LQLGNFRVDTPALVMTTSLVPFAALGPVCQHKIFQLV